MNVKNSVSWQWVGRDGTQRSIGFELADLSPAAIEEARHYALLAGYPGHKGGWWNYFLEDICRAVRWKNKSGQ